MHTQDEVTRLKEVYQTYSASPAARARWDVQNRGNRLILRERQRLIAAVLEAGGFLPLAGWRILEVGCGAGGVLQGLMRLGAQAADIYGLDLLVERIGQAQQHNPGMHFLAANAEALPFGAASFDLIPVCTVFSSILDQHMATQAAAEIGRLLRPGGAVLWYDFRYNNPRNPHVRGMTRAAIRALFPGFELRLRTTTLLPPLARRLGPATPLLYPLFARVPLLRTHYLGLLVKQ
jgi:ubiquinone/menaquinone biosynthesis C-methylase UbiE